MKRENLGLVSVVMPVYNSAHYLGTAVNSVLAQTYSKLELIIVYDKSMDDTWKIINEYAAQDERVHVIENYAGHGVSGARNVGIQAAKGKFVAFADSDDIWVTDKLERQIDLWRKTKGKLIYASYDFIDQNGESINRPYIVVQSTNYDKLLVENAIGTSTVLVEADCIKKYAFREDFYQEDYVLWLEVLRDHGKVYGEPNVLVHYRMTRGSRSDNKWRAAKSRWLVYRKFLKLPAWKSLSLWIPYCVLSVRKYIGLVINRKTNTA